MTNEQLAIRVKQGIDTADNMLLLWQQNSGIVRIIANRYSQYVELEDLMQEGYIALCQAVDAFDPERGKFLTVARWYLNNGMRRYLENNGRVIRIPSCMSEKVGRYARTRDAWASRSGAEPSDQELCEALEVDECELSEIKRAATMNHLQRLDAPAQMPSGQDDVTLSETIPDSMDLEHDVMDRIEQKELESTLWAMVDALPDSEPEVIRHLYADNMTVKAVSVRTGRTYKETRAIKDRALRRLRRQEGLLRAHLPETLEAAAYRGTLASFNRTWTSSTEKAAIKLAGQE